MVFGGIYSSTRQAIKGPAVVEGKTLYIYPEQYEGQECDPLIFCTGPVPAQQVEPLIPWLMERTGAKTFFLPSADYIWPHMMNEKVREVVEAAGGEIVGEEYFPLDHTDYGETIEKIMSSGADVVFNTIVPPGLMPFFQQLHDAGLHAAWRAPRLHVLRRELPEPGAGRAGRGPVRLPRLLPRRRAIRSAGSCSPATTSASPAARCSRPAALLGHVPGAEAVGGRRHARRARSSRTTWSRRSTTQRSPSGPGGPAEMVPGQHHVRMNMYIAQADGGSFKVVKELGLIEPKEAVHAVA